MVVVWEGERTLSARGGFFELVPAWDVRRGAAQEQLSPLGVRAWLAPMFADPRAADHLRGLAGQLTLAGPSFDDREVLQRLVEAVERGVLVLVRAERAWDPAVGVAGPVQHELPRGEAAADTRAHWIALRVVDDDSAEPVPDLDVVVGLPDRREVQATTDGDGRVELRAGEGGSCDVRGAGVGEHFSLCVTFVGTGRAFARGAAATSAPRGLVARGRRVRDGGRRSLLDVQTYRVRDGDTWDAIAERHGTGAAELMRFNFDTTDPAEIQRAMSEHLGCWRRDPATGALMFTADDDPGVLLVPRPWQHSLATGYEHVLRVRAIRAPSRPYVFSV